MGRNRTRPPLGVPRLKFYGGLWELLIAFAKGRIPLLVILGRPGLEKSRRACARP